MDDFDQQIASTDPQAQAVRRRLPAIPTDSYTLLLLVGVIVLFISLIWLASLNTRYYGLELPKSSVRHETSRISAPEALWISPGDSQT